MASGLPPYEERVLLSSMDTEEDASGFSQRSAYDAVFDTLRAALMEVLAKGSKRLLATYLQTLLTYPDGCTRGETVFDPESEEVLIQVPPLSEEKLYPKEQALVDLVAAERAPCCAWAKTDSTESASSSPLTIRRAGASMRSAPSARELCSFFAASLRASAWRVFR